MQLSSQPTRQFLHIVSGRYLHRMQGYVFTYTLSMSRRDTSSKHRMITTYEDASGLFATVLPDLRHGLDRREQPANLMNSLLASMGEVGGAEGDRDG